MHFHCILHLPLLALAQGPPSPSTPGTPQPPNSPLSLGSGKVYVVMDLPDILEVVELSSNDAPMEDPKEDLEEDPKLGEN